MLLPMGLNVKAQNHIGLGVNNQLELQIPAGHSGTINELTLTSDSKYIFSTSYSDGVRIWQNFDKKLLKRLPTEKPGHIIENKLNNQQMIFVYKSRIAFFDIEKFEITAEIKVDSLNIRTAILSNKGDYLYLAGGSTNRNYRMMIYKIQLGENKIDHFFQTYDSTLKYNNEFTNLSINSSDQKLLAVASGWGGSYLIDINTKNVIKKFDVKYQKLMLFGPSDEIAEVDYNDKKISCKVFNQDASTLLWESKVPTTGSIIYFRKNYFLDAKSKRLYITTQSDLIAYDFINKKLVSSKQLKEQHNNIIIVSPKSDLLYVATNQFLTIPSIIITYDINTFNKRQEIALPPYISWDFKSFNKSNSFISISLSGFLKKISFGSKGLKVESYEKETRNSGVAIAPDDKEFILSANAYPTFDVFNSLDSISFKKQFSQGYLGSADDIFYSDDGTLFAAVGNLNTTIYDSKTNELLSDFPNGYYSIFNFSGLGAFSKNKNFIVYQGKQKGSNDRAIEKTVCYNIKTKQKVWELSQELLGFRYINNDQQILCFRISSSPAIVTLNALTGELIKSVPLSYKDIASVTLSPDNKYCFVIANKYNINQVEVATGKHIQTYAGHTSSIRKLNFLKGNEFLLSGSEDNTIRIWDLLLKQEVGKIFLFDKNNNWVLSHPSGRFDATEDAMNDLYYVKGKSIIPLDALYEKLYTPLLLTSILNHRPISSPNISDIKIRPYVKVNYQEKTRNLLVVDDDKPVYNNQSGVAELTIQATAEDDSIDEIRLFHNGKAVNLVTRGLLVADDKQVSTTKKYSISLLPGENRFKAIALNSQRTESVPDEIIVQFSPKGSSPATDIKVASKVEIDQIDKNGTLHLLIIGINTYKNPKLNLNYAIADANGFRDEIQRTVKSVISNVKTYYVANTDANKANITAAFENIKQSAKPQDVFIFYYAGHGIVSEKNGEFYLVPTEVTNLSAIDAELEAKGVPSKFLQALSIDIQAQKQVFILDACQSAGAFETMLKEQSTQQKNFAVVARSTGTHWLAASGSTQYANEFSSLGHGVFTYALINALKGEAATNNMITVNGLKNFIQIKVPEILKSYGGTSQYPSSYGFGKDFPLDIKK